MYLAQRKQSKSMCPYTRIYSRRRLSPYGRLCWSSNPQRYGTGTHIALPYEPYYTVTVRSPIHTIPYHSYHTIVNTLPYHIPHCGTAIPYHTIHTIPWYGHIIPYNLYHTIAITIPYTEITIPYP